jgi:hypothetical protein
MDHADTASEKCGDVVDMWLGMLDIANMTKKHFAFMDSRADPGELLAGLEASINVFEGTTHSTQTFNSKRNLSKLTHMTHDALRERQGEKILNDCPVYRALNIMCPMIEVIFGLYAQSLKKAEDDPLGHTGQSEGGGQPASSKAASGRMRKGRANHLAKASTTSYPQDRGV